MCTMLIGAASVIILNVLWQLLHRAAAHGTRSRHSGREFVLICILCETEITKLTLYIVFQNRNKTKLHIPFVADPILLRGVT